MASATCELLVILPMLILIIFTSVLFAALIYALATPLASRLASKKTSSAARQVTKLQLYAAPQAATSIPLEAAKAPAIAVPCPHPASGVSVGPYGMPNIVLRGSVTDFSTVLPPEFPWLNAEPRFSWSNSQPVSITKTLMPAPLVLAHADGIL